MPYSLTLTQSERNAFDWIGNRYATGNQVADVLTDCLPPDCEWNGDGEITFAIPEHAAWRIHALAEEENNLWPCFSAELAEKMQRLCDTIV